MKKTLMVLSLALCASFAFAQTNRVADRPVKLGQKADLNKVAVVDLNKDAMAGYKGSIFTKEEEVIATFDFSMDATAPNSNYSIGQIAAGDMIDDARAKAHTQTAAFSKWRRWSSVDPEVLAGENLATIYPTYGYLFLTPGYILNPDYALDTEYCSSTNGWMCIMPYEDNGNHYGDFNAYIKFNQMDLSTYPMVKFSLFQFYDKYYDHCFVDYSTDGGSTWHAVEINVPDVDVNINGRLWGRSTYALPSTAISSTTVLRLRFFSDRIAPSGNAVGAYGYWWLLDDVMITSADANSLKQFSEYYYNGGYQLMPLGMETPLEWFSEVVNDGYEAQTNATLAFTHIAANGATSTIDEYQIGTIASMEDSMYEFMSEQSLPTSAMGENYVTTTLTTDALSLQYDTIYYQVNKNNVDTTHIWGRDNGVLRLKSAFAFGYEYEDGNTYITDYSDNFSSRGYSVMVSYTTGAEVPVDEDGQPWVVRGIQYVPATRDGYCVGTNSIYPTLTWDSVPGDGYMYFKTLDLGVDAITSSATNDSLDVLDNGGYMTIEDGYNTINVEVRTQPELKPGTTYRVGYQLAQDGLFAVAEATDNYYWTRTEGGDSLKTVRFASDPLTKKYASSFTPGHERMGNGGDVRVIDPTNESSLWAAYYHGYYPMIRLVVGPRRQYTQYDIHVECEYEDDDMELGAVLTSDENDACGNTVSMPEGTMTYIYILPGENAHYTLTDNGVVIPSDAIQHNEGYDVYEFNDIRANHDVRVSFAFGEGIDPVAGHVRMNLQPNPASSQVKLNIEGVAGMVNCSLIDMSGRTVFNRNINAETEQVINLDNLAKGAYFVRITNNDFTKVERLIVR